MRIKQLKHWIEKIYATQKEEISCSECFRLVSVFVDRELAGEDLNTMLMMVKQHLDLCQVCQEEYEILRELAEDEQ
jgi:CRISPR/Cas system-associated protein Cas10 (large subunit of type III CRISPR-Cas system)